MDSFFIFLDVNLTFFTWVGSAVLPVMMMVKAPLTFTSRSSLANAAFSAATGAGVESVDPEERPDLADPTASTLALLAR